MILSSEKKNRFSKCYLSQECDNEHWIMQYFELYFEIIFSSSLFIYSTSTLLWRITPIVLYILMPDGHTNWCQRFWMEWKKGHSMDPSWTKTSMVCWCSKLSMTDWQVLKDCTVLCVVKFAYTISILMIYKV